MKQTWLIYHDGVYVDTQWERTVEEAIIAHRATYHPPQEGDDLYGNDKPIKVTAKRLIDAPVAADHVGFHKAMNSPLQGTVADEWMKTMREMVSRYPFNIVHTGSKHTEHGVIDSYAIDIESGPLRGQTNQMNIIKGRSEYHTPDFDTLSLEDTELQFVYGPDAARQKEKALRYLAHYGSFPILPDPILTKEQAAKLREGFYESFNAFKALSDSFTRFSQTLQLADRWEGPRRTAIRLIHDTLQDMAAEQKRNAPKGPQPHKKWPTTRKLTK